jgi:peptidyl-prolyl isomerase D
MYRAFKKGDFAVALDKYQKALRYLDVHPVLPDDAPADLVKAFRDVRFPLLTNAALSALKCTPPAGKLAVSLATRALSVEDLTPPEKGKALYRRALGKIQAKDDEGAEQDLKASLEHVPGDAGSLSQLKLVEQRRKERREKEKKAYAKMFG